MQTKKEFQEFISKEENKVLFEQVAKAAGYESAEEVKGLKDKNYELLGKMKEHKDETEKVRKQLDSIDQVAYNDYVSKKDNDKTEEEKLSVQKTRFEESLREESAKYKNLETEFNNNMIGLNLSSTFEELGIDSKHKQILTSAFFSKAKVEMDNGKRKVVIDDDGLGITTKEYFQKWVETDQGKEYLKKPENSGAAPQKFEPSGNNKGTLGQTVQESLKNLS